MKKIHTGGRNNYKCELKMALQTVTFKLKISARKLEKNTSLCIKYKITPAGSVTIAA
jgi:hypothetical protein